MSQTLLESRAATCEQHCANHRALVDSFEDTPSWKASLFTAQAVHHLRGLRRDLDGYRDDRIARLDDIRRLVHDTTIELETAQRRLTPTFDAAVAGSEGHHLGVMPFQGPWNLMATAEKHLGFDISPHLIAVCWQASPGLADTGMISAAVVCRVNAAFDRAAMNHAAYDAGAISFLHDKLSRWYDTARFRSRLCSFVRMVESGALGPFAVSRDGNAAVADMRNLELLWELAAIDL